MVSRPSRRGRAAATLLVIAVAAIASRAAEPVPQITFTDITSNSGIAFVHHNGAAGSMWYPELFGGGVAVLDIDGDTWPDLLFVNGRDWRADGQPGRHGLFLNNRDGT